MPVLADFESRSRADLKRIGGRNYWAHASTEAICAVLYDTDTGAVGLWMPGQPCPVTPDTVLGAHNARGFDRFAALKYWGLDIEIDTSELARRKGLRGALEALNGDKDTAGKALTLSLSGFQCRGDTKRKDGTIKRGVPEELKAALREYHREAKRDPGTWPTIPPEIHARVVEYCADDVQEMATAWPELAPWLDIPWENDVLAADRAVNERGVAFDSQLARRLIEVIDANGAVELERCARELDMSADALRDVVMSPEQFAAFTGLPDAKVETVNEVLTVGSFEYETLVVFACEARRAVASIARGKLEAGLARVSPDGRIRDSLIYYGGHPGRWSHRGMQLGNMPRPEKRFENWEDADVCRAADAVLAGGLCDAGTVDVLLRATLVGDGGPLVVCDFSGVESRAAAWFAGDAKALEVIASGKDEYKVTAAAIYRTSYDAITKEQRQAGKVAVLACGYGGGANALVSMARKSGIDLEAAGVDPATIVAGWRELHAPIVRLWYALEDALLAAVRGREARVTWAGGRHAFTFTPSVDGRDVAVFLPSGRPLVYNQVRESPGKFRRPRISYQGTKPWREDLYGGKILQNLNEAYCRDMMADVLVRVERAGLEPVLHVHDEIVSQRGTLADLHEIMTTLPAWARGFPIDAAGHEGMRYRK